MAGAVAATVLFSALLSIPAVGLRADPIVIAVGLNLLALGLTAFLMRQIFGSGGTYSSPTWPDCRTWANWASTYPC